MTKAALFLSAALIIVSVALVPGCASTPSVGDSSPKATFQKPIERVQKAAIDALVENGFELNKQEPTYVEGSRPRKWRPFGGTSGGETVGIWLTSQAQNQTEVKLDTAKSAYGYLIQQDWCDKIMETMADLLVK